MLIWPSFVYLIPVILVLDEACLCIFYTYPECTCPLILLFLLDLYMCYKTMRHSWLDSVIYSCNLHWRCVHIYNSTSFSHLLYHTILASISVKAYLHAMNVMDFNAHSLPFFFWFTVSISFKYVVQTAHSILLGLLLFWCFFKNITSLSPVAFVFFLYFYVGFIWAANNGS